MVNSTSQILDLRIIVTGLVCANFGNHDLKSINLIKKREIFFKKNVSSLIRKEAR